MAINSPETDPRSQLFRHGAPVRLEQRNLRLVIGVTSDQTCLVLRGRLRSLRLAGFKVTLISSPGESLDRIAAEEGIDAYPLPMKRGIAPFSDLRSFLALCRFLSRVRPAIADFSTPKAGLLGNIAGWLTRIPHRVYTLRGLKLEGTRGAKRRLLLLSERVASGCADLVLCNSSSLRALARELRLGPERKLRLLGDGSSNGVDTARFSPGSSAVRAEFGFGAEEFVLGFVGRLTKDKGIPDLLEAFDEIARAEPLCWLLLVGWFDESEDALDAGLRQRIAAHPRIRCTGFVIDTVPYYRAMDLFVLPTHREGFPNVVLEASACGLAVITTESTGARDAVLPEVTGRLIPPENSGAISDSVLELLRDSEKRARLGAAGRAWILERYTRERVLGLAAAFYRELLTPAEAALLRADVETKSQS
jgi:glycosyltransferase involved in cell wall biosynthesis